jgi:hypothetical protein
MTKKTPAIATLLALALTAALAAFWTLASSAQAAPVSVYPSPGARTASAQTQLSFRGVAPGSVGAVEVVGSRSGSHTGRLAAHPDGDGASFLPDHPFTAGETVTVHTGLDVAGAHDGDFTLTIATPGPPLKAAKIPPAILTGSGVQLFHSRHDLVPPKITVDADKPGTAPGDLFLGAFSAPGAHGPGQNGPMVLDQHGRLVWFHPIGGNQLALDVRAQSYQGQPVLTWWQGFNARGLGNGVGVIYDRSYRQIAVVHAGNGLQADPHEFLLTPRGTALIAAENPVVQDLSKVHGARRAVVYDSVVQEVDVQTGLVLFEWHSLDHVGVEESHTRPPRVDGHLYDYFHINSIAQLSTGDLVISGRNTWGVYKLDRATGAVDWRLGGTRSSFRAGPGASFSWQHDARVTRDGTITLYDDGPTAGTGNQSRGIGLRLDTHRRTVRLVHDYRHTPKLLSNSQGDLQTLPNGNALIGWGSQPFLTEFAPHGQTLFDAHFPRGGESYRAYRLPWDGTPQTLPSVAASSDGHGTTTVYASWNGSDDVARWQVLAGPNASSLNTVATKGRAGFETTFAVRTSAPVVAVRALGADGSVLATSGAITPIAGG